MEPEIRGFSGGFLAHKIPSDMKFKNAPRLKEFQGYERMTSAWLKEILKFTVPKKPQIERFSRIRVNDFTIYIVVEKLETQSFEIPLIECISRTREKLSP